MVREGRESRRTGRTITGSSECTESVRIWFTEFQPPTDFIANRSDPEDQNERTADSTAKNSRDL